MTDTELLDALQRQIDANSTSHAKCVWTDWPEKDGRLTVWHYGAFDVRKALSDALASATERNGVT